VGCDLDLWLEARERLRHRHVGPDGAGPDPVPLHFPPGQPRPASTFVPFNPPPPAP
jgi:hypothetical protein